MSSAVDKVEVKRSKLGTTNSLLPTQKLVDDVMHSQQQRRDSSNSSGFSFDFKRCSGDDEQQQQPSNQTGEWASPMTSFDDSSGFGADNDQQQSSNSTIDLSLAFQLLQQASSFLNSQQQQQQQENNCELKSMSLFPEHQQQQDYPLHSFHHHHHPHNHHHSSLKAESGGKSSKRKLSNCSNSSSKRSNRSAQAALLLANSPLSGLSTVPGAVAVAASPAAKLFDEGDWSWHRNPAAAIRSGGTNKQTPVWKYFVYNKAENLSRCIVGECVYTLKGPHTSTLACHLKKHPAEYAEFQKLKADYTRERVVHSSGAPKTSENSVIAEKLLSKKSPKHHHDEHSSNSSTSSCSSASVSSMKELNGSSIFDNKKTTPSELLFASSDAAAAELLAQEAHFKTAFEGGFQLNKLSPNFHHPFALLNLKNGGGEATAKISPHFSQTPYEHSPASQPRQFHTTPGTATHPAMMNILASQLFPALLPFGMALKQNIIESQQCIAASLASEHETKNRSVEMPCSSNNKRNASESPVEQRQSNDNLNHSIIGLLSARQQQQEERQAAQNAFNGIASHAINLSRSEGKDIQQQHNNNNKRAKCKSSKEEKQRRHRPPTTTSSASVDVFPANRACNNTTLLQAELLGLTIATLSAQSQTMLLNNLFFQRLLGELKMPPELLTKPKIQEIAEKRFKKTIVALRTILSSADRLNLFIDARYRFDFALKWNGKNGRDLGQNQNSELICVVSAAHCDEKIANDHKRMLLGARPCVANELWKTAQEILSLYSLCPEDIKIANIFSFWPPLFSEKEMNCSKFSAKIVHLIYPDVLDYSLETVFNENEQVQELVRFVDSALGEDKQQDWKSFFERAKSISADEHFIQDSLQHQQQSKKEMLAEFTEVLSSFCEKIHEEKTNQLSIGSVIPRVKDARSSLLLKTSSTIATLFEDLQRELDRETRHIMNPSAASFEGIFIVATALDPEFAHHLNATQLAYAKMHLLEKYPGEETRSLNEYFQTLNGNLFERNDDDALPWSTSSEHGMIVEKIRNELDIPLVYSHSPFNDGYLSDFMGKSSRENDEPDFDRWSSSQFERSVIILYNPDI